MGVWIETDSMIKVLETESVTPCVGVWIETNKEVDTGQPVTGHTLRGCVD